MIGIIGAMDVEIAKLKSLMVGKEEKRILDRDFFIGEIMNKTVVLVSSGIGKVNSAITTSLLLENFGIDYIINVGVAGGLSPVRVLDLIIGSQLCYHDVDLSALGYEKGRIPHQPIFFNADEMLVKRAQKIAIKNNKRNSVGIIASGDSFVTNSSLVRILNDCILAVEMEGASIAQVCSMYKKPFIVLRVVSDVLDADEQTVSFQKVEEEAANLAASFVQGFLE